MTEPILSHDYWRDRIAAAERIGQPHQAFFLCNESRWKRIEAKHRQILRQTIGHLDSVLDAGCGWGRLLDLMPGEWIGDYLGVDLSPDFLQVAKGEYPHRHFVQGDLRDLRRTNEVCLQGSEPWFDWAVLVSIRPMVLNNLGGDAWAAMSKELHRVARRLLFLEYNEADEGSVE